MSSTLSATASSMDASVAATPPASVAQLAPVVPPVPAAAPAPAASHAPVAPATPATPSAPAASSPAPTASEAQPAAAKLDRRSLRTQRLLRHALADEINSGEDLSRITVAALTDRAGLTRRTFYTHYRDMPDFIEQVEQTILAQIRSRIAQVVATDLAGLYRNIDELEPAPGSVELLGYLKRNGALIGALLGPSGDPAFAQRIQAIAREAVSERLKTGIFPGALGTFFDYYLSYVVAAEMGIIRRWFERGLAESPETVARLCTVIAFVRPGDLYGKPIDINVPAYGMKLFNLHIEDQKGSSHE